MKALLQAIGRAIPDIRYLRALPNILLVPLHHRLGYGGGETDVLGSRMFLDTSECCDTGLWFQPHVYDNKERKYVLAHASEGLMLDVGANIGVWSLFLARHFPESKIVSIEANPATFDILTDHIELNGYTNIELHQCGVGYRPGVLPLHLNKTGNRGGDSFVHSEKRSDAIDVPIKRLSDIISADGPEIEFMKIDIEGMELDVLRDMIENLDRRVWPRLICIETLHSSEPIELLLQNEYVIRLRARENALLEKIQAP